MNANENETTVVAPDELATLKSRADMLGVQYHPSIGLEKLREKVNGTLADKPLDSPTSNSAASVGNPEVETENQRRFRLKREATKLVRVNITCMNPAKKEWDGEILTVGNSEIGSIKKFVPFNTTDGWHITTIMLQMMRERKCQIFVTAKDDRGNKSRKGKLINEFAIEVLDPLTPAELAELAARQAATKSIE